MIILSSLQKKADFYYKNKNFEETLIILKREETEYKNFHKVKFSIDAFEESIKQFIVKNNNKISIMYGLFPFLLIYCMKIIRELTNFPSSFVQISYISLLLLSIGIFSIYTYKKDIKLFSTLFRSSIITILGFGIFVLIKSDISVKFLIGLVFLWLIYLFLSLIICWITLFVFKKNQKCVKVKSSKKQNTYIDNSDDCYSFIRDRLQKCLYRQGKIYYFDLKNDEIALKLFKEQEVICREIDEKWGLLNSLSMQAGIYYEFKEIESARLLTIEILSLLEEFENEYYEGNKKLKSNLFSIYVTLKFIYRNLDQIDKYELYSNKLVQLEK